MSACTRVSDWHNCSCFHLGVDHETDGPCTAVNCECDGFVMDPLWNDGGAA